ncbi:hypothetical protein PR002_g13774 [Phytophthora rubi]|uniref:Secreted protein n=1 Tax=Phytophthora rubi TaxID=129364 RepID=A0A6A3LJQ2_9STRA|nr:hypothetical protein PR002_g13774 [Phytophthora rubi]
MILRLIMNSFCVESSLTFVWQCDGAACMSSSKKCIRCNVAACMQVLTNRALGTSIENTAMTGSGPNHNVFHDQRG